MRRHASIGKAGEEIRLLLLALVLAQGVGGLVAQQPVDHPVLQKMAGTWKSEGQLTVAESGDVIPVTEKWTGKFDDQGRLVIDGTRTLGDNEHTFRWVYLFNSATELYEVIYSDSNSEEEKSWQVSISEVDSVVEMHTDLGGGSALTSRSTVSDGRVVSKVKIVDQGGAETVSGSINHVREGADKPDDK